MWALGKQCMHYSCERAGHYSGPCMLCRHGSAALQTHQASMPVIVDYAEDGGFDYLSTQSCKAIRPFIYGAPEIVMHIQTLLFAVNYDGSGINSQAYGGDQTGPTDDGYISSALGTTPQVKISMTPYDLLFFD